MKDATKAMSCVTGMDVCTDGRPPRGRVIDVIKVFLPL